jgi:TolB protein
MTMRSKRNFVGMALVAAALALFFGSPQATAQGKKAEQDPEAILRHFLIEGSRNEKPLPKIAVQPSLESNIEDVTIHSVVKRDLDLCGEFELLPDSAAPEGLYLSGTPVDVEAWKKKGAEAVVKVSGKKLTNGKVELSGVAYFTNSGDAPVFDKRFVVDGDDVRFESHRVADVLIGALTGTPGGFTSELAFIYGTGKQRRVYRMDADGHQPRAVSPPEQLALSPDFGPNHKLFYAASIKSGSFKVFGPGSSEPLSFKPRGSVYGLAFSRDRDEVAVSIAQGAGIKLFRGPDFQHLKQASQIDLAMHPTWSPTGKLAFSGAGQFGQRIYVDDKPVSPAGLHASAPVFCRHPDGIKLIYGVGLGKNMDLVSAPETGGGLQRLTQGAGRNMYPACSPDGRLIAFFSTRKGGEGPGLYVMRIDGRRPKRISTLVGDSLHWARVPDKAPKASKPAPKPATGSPAPTGAKG